MADNIQNMLSVLIKVAKEGNADQEFIGSLQKIQAQAKATDKSLGALTRAGSLSEEQAKLGTRSNTGLKGSLDGVVRSTGQAGAAADLHRSAMNGTAVALAKMVGVNENVVLSLRAVTMASKAAGAGLTGLLIVGAAGAGAAAAKFLIDLEDRAYESGKAARDLEDRVKKLKVAIGAPATGKGFLEVMKADAEAAQEQIQALGKLAGEVFTAGARANESKDVSDQQASLAEIGRASKAGSAESARKLKGVGAGVLSNIGLDRDSAKQAAADAVEVINAELAQGLQVKKIFDDAFNKQSGIREDLKAAILDVTRELQSAPVGSAEEKRLQEELQALQATAQQVEVEFLKNAAALHKQAEAVQILQARQLAVKKTAEETLKVRQAELGLLESEKKADLKREVLSVQEQFNTALKEEFELEAKQRGIENDRAAQAYAIFQIKGRTVDAERLLTLELEKQKKIQVTPSQQAGSAIAKAKGLNVDAISSQGANLGERSQLRTLASTFNQDISTEENRLKKSGIRDPLQVQKKLAEFASAKLEDSPTLKKQLGVTDAETGKTEGDKLIDKAGSLQLADKAGKSSESAKKAFDDLTKKIGTTADAQLEAVKVLSSKLDAVTAKVKTLTAK